MFPIIVQKGRTIIVPVSFPFDISADTFVSEIRVDKDPESDLIATWEPTFETDGTDGELILTLDDSVTSTIKEYNGYMDIKRLVAGQEPIPVFDDPLEVIFKNTVTA